MQAAISCSDEFILHSIQSNELSHFFNLLFLQCLWRAGPWVGCELRCRVQCSCRLSMWMRGNPPKDPRGKLRLQATAWLQPQPGRTKRLCSLQSWVCGFHRWEDKQTVAQPLCRTWLSSKKEPTTDTLNSTGELQNHWAEGKKPGKKSSVWLHL